MRVGARPGEKGVVTSSQHDGLTLRLARLRRIVAALRAVRRCQTDHDLNLALEELDAVGRAPLPSPVSLFLTDS